MPIAAKRSGGSRQLAILAFATVAALGSMLFVVSRAGEVVGSDRIDINLGEEVFVAGNVDRLSEDIAGKGPLLMPDLIADRDRDVYLQHVGDDKLEGWYAFAARPVDASRDCFVEWKADNRTFVDVCDGTVYDETGTGLTAYPVSVAGDGTLSVDINAADRADAGSESETESEAESETETETETEDSDD